VRATRSRIVRARLVRIPARRALRARMRGLRLDSVLEVVEVLAAARAPAWVAGGATAATSAACGG
jgi:hypothetical protein